MKLNMIVNRAMHAGIGTVFIANSINKVVAFISNAFIVRYISQYSYGLYSSANNIIEFALLFTGLGMLSSVFQYGAENRSNEEKCRYFRYGLLFGCIIDIVISLCVCLYAYSDFIALPESRKYILYLVPIIMLHYIYEYCGIILRSKKNVRNYSKLLNVNSICISALSCLGVILIDAYGLILARIISCLISILLGFYYIKIELSGLIKADKLNVLERKQMIKYAVSCCISGSLNRLLYILDVLMISYIIKSPNDIAFYKVGAQIPEALEFIPQSILAAVLPYFAENSKNVMWLRKWTKVLYCISAVGNLWITIILVVMAPYIVPLIWGQEYIQSIPIFRILSMNFFIMATFRQNGTNILAVLRETKYNVIISIITCVVNIILDVVCIMHSSIMGAAIATVMSTLVAAGLSFPYIIKYVYKS